MRGGVRVWLMGIHRAYRDTVRGGVRVWLMGIHRDYRDTEVRGRVYECLKVAYWSSVMLIEIT